MVRKLIEGVWRLVEVLCFERGEVVASGMLIARVVNLKF